ncbi:MAG TPA: class I SAM-dependent methyltransferase [Acidimicrobiia bacterium]|nr:class I SAM-dependent methyltransferase [Acidimicrobiia bacterium]
MNTDAWDRIAARRGGVADTDVVSYGFDLPTEAELRLCGEVRGKRVLDLGCGAGENAIAFTRHGAHVIAIDRSVGQLQLARKLAEAAEVRVEWHQGDAADLAFLRADSIDVACAVQLIGEVEDLDRLFRQVHRVLRPGSPFVFSYDHPTALVLGRETSGPGSLPLGRFELRRSYFETAPAAIRRDDEQITVFPRTIADVFASLHRAGYRVDALLEPEAVRSSDPGPAVPTSLIWRARKEGV